MARVLFGVFEESEDDFAHRHVGTARALGRTRRELGEESLVLGVGFGTDPRTERARAASTVLVHVEDDAGLVLSGLGTAFRGRGVLITLVLRELPQNQAFESALRNVRGSAEMLRL